MIKLISISASILFSVSCFAQDDNGKKSYKNNIEIYIDQIIDVKNDITIEFPFLYDSLTAQILVDEEESIKIAEILKSKGFIVNQRDLL